jgi:hypothetical protein
VNEVREIREADEARAEPAGRDEEVREEPEGLQPQRCGAGAERRQMRTAHGSGGSREPALPADRDERVQEVEPGDHHFGHNVCGRSLSDNAMTSGVRQGPWSNADVMRPTLIGKGLVLLLAEI